MKKDNKVEMSHVYSMITDIYIHSMYWFMRIIAAVTVITVPLNIKLRPEEKTRILAFSAIILFFILLMTISIRILIKIKISEENRMFLLAFLLVSLFCILGYALFSLNHLLWSFILFGVVLTVFIFKFSHKLILQSLCYITIIALMISEQFSAYILPQRITVIAVMIIASIVSYYSSKVIKELIIKLMTECEKQRESNEQITVLNNELEERVELRTEELEATLEDLKNTQDRLMKTESMESFLLLAKGLSHQINTPLGVSLTSNSYVSSLLEDVENLIEKKEITQSDMIKKIADMNSACDLIGNNIKKSVQVVDSLKRFTLYEVNKKINLKSSLDYLKTRLMETELYKDVTLDIIVNSEKEIRIAEKTFHEVVMTMIENSLIHGKRDDLVVQIIDKSDNKNIIIEIVDNGVGIKPEIYEEIFNSFYSTTPHNLGMGLFIAESIVYHNLKGKLYLDKDYHNGTKMVIRIPNSIL